MTDIIPTAAEAKDLADDCCEALAGLLLRPTTTARRPITQRILAEMQKTLNDESWPGGNRQPDKNLFGIQLDPFVYALSAVARSFGSRPLGLRLR